MLQHIHSTVLDTWEDSNSSYGKQAKTVQMNQYQPLSVPYHNGRPFRILPVALKDGGDHTPSEVNVLLRNGSNHNNTSLQISDSSLPQRPVPSSALLQISLLT